MKIKDIAFKIAFKLGQRFGFSVTVKDYFALYREVIPDYFTVLAGNDPDPDAYKRILINALAEQVHEANKKWWTDLETGRYPIERNFGELLCLVHSEISEALEGARKNIPDTHLVHRPMAEVELADAIIRILDIAAGFGYDLGGAYVEKMAFNAVRKDHSLEERKKENGKRF